MAAHEAGQKLLAAISRLNPTKQKSPDATSDAIIKCKNEEWHVHRNVVGAQSPLLERRLQNALATRDRKHLSTKPTIDLSGETTFVVTCIIEFMYTLDYGCFADVPSVPCHYQNIRMYMAADTFDIPALKDLAFTKFCDDQAWCVPGNFTDGLRLLFTTPLADADDIREKAISVAAEHADELLVFAEKGQWPFRKLLDDLKSFKDRFDTAAMKQRRKTIDDELRLTCEHCNKFFILMRAELKGSYACPYCKLEPNGDQEALELLAATGGLSPEPERPTKRRRTDETRARPASKPLDVIDLVSQTP